MIQIVLTGKEVPIGVSRTPSITKRVPYSARAALRTVRLSHLSLQSDAGQALLKYIQIGLIKSSGKKQPSFESS